MRYFFLFCLLGMTTVNAQQFINGSFEPTGTVTSCSEVPSSVFSTQMGNLWCNSGTNQVYVGDNTCGTASAGTHFIGLEYNSMLGGTNVVFKLSSPMLAGNTYKFSFAYKLSASSAGATVFFGYNNPTDSLGHDSTITFLMPPTTTSWVTITDSIKPTINSQWFFIRGGTLGSSPLVTYLDDFKMNCVAAPAPAFTSTGTHTVAFTYTGTTDEDSVRWHFGDGGTSAIINPTHIYSANGTYSVCVTAYNTCGNNTICHNTVANLAGIANVAGMEIKIYPNPVGAQLVIEDAPLGATVAVLNVLGRAAYTGIIATDKETISTSGLPPGIYIIQLTDKEGNRTLTRVVKE